MNMKLDKDLQSSEGRRIRMNPEIEQRFASLENCQPLPLANHSGVYFLCQGTTVVYVGKAKNIARRVASHIGVKDFDTVMVLQVPEESLASVEIHWIKQLQPKLNRSVIATASSSYLTGRPKLNKRTVSIRLSESVLAQAKIAAALSGNLSAWIEEAIKAQLKEDGIR